MNAQDYHWITKPPLGYGIDLSHPHAQNCNLWWLANEGSGLGLDDLTPWKNRGVFSATGAVWSPSVKGSSVSLTLSTGRIDANPASGLQTLATISAPWSMEVWASMTTTVNLAAVFGMSLTDPSGSPATGQLRGFLQFGGSSPNYHVYFWGSGADWDSGIAWNIDGLPHCYLFTSNGGATGTVTLYIDGVSKASGTPGGSLTTGTTPRAWAGARHGAAATTFGGKFISGRIWSANVGAMAASLFEDPYGAILAPPTRRFVGSSSQILAPYYYQLLQQSS